MDCFLVPKHLAGSEHCGGIYLMDHEEGGVEVFGLCSYGGWCYTGRGRGCYCGVHDN